jgi:hypothetical protein
MLHIIYIGGLPQSDIQTRYHRLRLTVIKEGLDVRAVMPLGKKNNVVFPVTEL